MLGQFSSDWQRFFFSQGRAINRMYACVKFGIAYIHNISLMFEADRQPYMLFIMSPT